MQSDNKKDDRYILKAFIGNDDDEPTPGRFEYHAPGNTEVKKIHVPEILAPKTDTNSEHSQPEFNKSKTSGSKKQMKSLKTLS